MTEYKRIGIDTSKATSSTLHGIGRKIHQCYRSISTVLNCLAFFRKLLPTEVAMEARCRKRAPLGS